MNRERFEEYCREHKWDISYASGWLFVDKYYMGSGHGVQLSHRFEIGMNLNILIDQMKEEDGITDDAQGEFLFAKTDELL